MGMAHSQEGVIVTRSTIHSTSPFHPSIRSCQPVLVSPVSHAHGWHTRRVLYVTRGTTSPAIFKCNRSRGLARATRVHLGGGSSGHGVDTAHCLCVLPPQLQPTPRMYTCLQVRAAERGRAAADRLVADAALLQARRGDHRGGTYTRQPELRDTASVHLLQCRTVKVY